MGILFRVVLLLVAALVVLGLAVVMASESGEVVVLRTSEPGGPGLETRLWVIDDGYQLWLRAGDPGSGCGSLCQRGWRVSRFCRAHIAWAKIKLAGLPVERQRTSGLQSPASARLSACMAVKMATGAVLCCLCTSRGVRPENVGLIHCEMC